MQTLIILHGWQSSKEKWQEIKEEIEEQSIRVNVPDLPGFKEDTKLGRPWNLDDYVEWVAELLPKVEEVAPPTIFLLGHSFGGRMAIKFAVKYPEKLKGLILVSSAGIKHKKNFCLQAVARIFSKFSFLPGYEFLRKVFYHKILGKTDYLKAEGALKETFKKTIEEDLTSLLLKIKVPTLIVWGEKDKITPLSDGYLIKERIESSKLEVLKGIGHTPHLENPELLSQEIINFIKQNSRI